MRFQKATPLERKTERERGGRALVGFCTFSLPPYGAERRRNGGENFSPNSNKTGEGY